nr:MAG TPA: hypothetical protein [Caudoviricetes sp.]
MSVINRTTEQSYAKWIEEFVCKVLENANIKFDTVEIEDIEIDKRIFIKVDGVEYIIRTWNFHPAGTDLQGIPCCELVDYSLFKSGEEIAKGKIEIQWEN